MSNSLNVTETIRQLEQQMKKTVDELRELNEELVQKMAEEGKLKQEIPSLQKEVEVDKHRLYEVDTSIPALKSKIALKQREHIKYQHDIAEIQKASLDSLRKLNQRPTK